MLSNRNFENSLTFIEELLLTNSSNSQLRVLVYEFIIHQMPLRMCKTLEVLLIDRNESATLMMAQALATCLFVSS